MSCYKLHAVTEAGRWKNVNEKDKNEKDKKEKAGVKERTDTSVFLCKNREEKFCEEERMRQQGTDLKSESLGLWYIKKNVTIKPKLKDRSGDDIIYFII